MNFIRSLETDLAFLEYFHDWAATPCFGGLGVHELSFPKKTFLDNANVPQQSSEVLLLLLLLQTENFEIAFKFALGGNGNS